ncbi:MAG: hypothetical protein KDI27_13940 [Gammaproteobacteria bacterium]|nr:hypothetical protein [Gammaproteobacteria bacterium]MCP5417681.1 hypothetical protein [Chromatiaceae bacterium]
MSLLSKWPWVGLMLALVACNGAETTSQDPLLKRFSNRHQPKGAESAPTRFSAMANLSGQDTLVNNPLFAGSPALTETPEQREARMLSQYEKLQQKLVRARSEGVKQLLWLQERLGGRLEPTQNRLQVAEAAYEQARRGEPELVEQDQRELARLEREADRVRLQLNRMSSRYTESFLAMDPVARELRQELDLIERREREIETAAVDKLLSQAWRALLEARTLAQEAQQHNQHLISRFESFMADLEQKPLPAGATAADPDVKEAEERLITAWKQVQ